MIIMALGLGGLGVTPNVVMTLLVIVWSLFAAPTWCGALNRKRGAEVDYCRNNASGLLLGCRIRQHKFQRFTRAWWTSSWHDRTRGMWTGAHEVRHPHRAGWPGLRNDRRRGRCPCSCDDHQLIKTGRADPIGPPARIRLARSTHRARTLKPRAAPALLAHPPPRASSAREGFGAGVEALRECSRAPRLSPAPCGYAHHQN